METSHPQNKQSRQINTQDFLHRMNEKHETRKPVRLTKFGKVVVWAAGVGVGVASLAGYNAVNNSLHPMPSWEGSVSYVVEPGDTVDNIVGTVPGASEYPKEELVELVEANNPGLEVTSIVPGQEIQLPESFGESDEQ